MWALSFQTLCSTLVSSIAGIDAKECLHSFKFDWKHYYNITYLISGFQKALQNEVDFLLACLIKDVHRCQKSAIFGITRRWRTWEWELSLHIFDCFCNHFWTWFGIFGVTSVIMSTWRRFQQLLWLPAIHNWLYFLLIVYNSHIFDLSCWRGCASVRPALFQKNLNSTLTSSETDSY